MSQPRKKLERLNSQLRNLKSIPILLLYLIFCLTFLSAEAKQNRFIKVFFPNDHCVTAELAVSDEERQLGLMFRERINCDQGMLFIFGEEGFHSFWMKDVNFPIDILWLDREKRIVHIESNVPPCKESPCPSYSPQVQASYVLELKSGSVNKNQLQLYDKLEFILPSGIRPRIILPSIYFVCHGNE